MRRVVGTLVGLFIIGSNFRIFTVFGSYILYQTEGNIEYN